MAERRLQMVEKIAKYREEKMRREYELLQEELEREAQREMQERIKEDKRIRRMEM